jgi:hypothetical protein
VRVLDTEDRGGLASADLAYPLWQGLSGLARLRGLVGPSLEVCRQVADHVRVQVATHVAVEAGNNSVITAAELVTWLVGSARGLAVVRLGTKDWDLYRNTLRGLKAAQQHDPQSGTVKYSNTTEAGKRELRDAISTGSSRDAAGSGSEPRFVRAANGFRISIKLQESQLCRLREVFECLDVGGSGVVPLEAFIQRPKKAADPALMRDVQLALAACSPSELAALPSGGMVFEDLLKLLFQDHFATISFIPPPLTRALAAEFKREYDALDTNFSGRILLGDGLARLRAHPRFGHAAEAALRQLKLVELQSEASLLQFMAVVFADSYPPRLKHALRQVGDSKWVTPSRALAPKAQQELHALFQTYALAQSDGTTRVPVARLQQTAAELGLTQREFAVWLQETKVEAPDALTESEFLGFYRNFWDRERRDV